MRARPLPILLVVLAGCGTERPGPPARPTPQPPLTEAQRADVLRLESRLQRHCVRVARSLVDPSAAPTAAQEQAAFAAADDLVARVSRTPRAPFGTGQDLRLFLSDVVENLEGSNCDPRLVSRLEAALARIPAE